MELCHLERKLHVHASDYNIKEVDAFYNDHYNNTGSTVSQ